LIRILRFAWTAWRFERAISPKPLEACAFPVSTAKKSIPRDEQPETPRNSPETIRFAKTTCVFMCGIVHNKTIATKTLSHRLKSCTRLILICLAEGLKLN
jgi:hypothetical protein